MSLRTAVYNWAANVFRADTRSFSEPAQMPEISPVRMARQKLKNAACGDVLRLTLNARGGRIALARFKAKGCVAAIARGSVLTELVVGKTLKEAQHLRPEDVSAAVAL
ncbi:MAG: iron-sulfur cluster assembly scaffold protein [Candidatus Sulfotelmatobacter sp.]